MKWRGNHNGRMSFLTILTLCGLGAGAGMASVSFAAPSPVRYSTQERQVLMSSRAVGEDDSQITRLIRSDESGVEIEIFCREFNSSQEEVEGQLYHHLSLEEAVLSLEEGKPQLPVRTITLGIPPEVDVVVDVVEAQTERSFGYRIYPAPRRVVSELPSGEIFTAQEFYRDENLYSQSLFYPPQVARIIQTAFIRDQRVAQCEVCPFQFNPASGELIFYRRLILRVTFVGGTQEDYGGFEEPDFVMATKSPFESVLKNVLLNYESSKRWRLPRTTAPKLMSVETETPYHDPTAYRVTLTEEGMYSMSWEYLESQGVDVSALDPRTMKMYEKGHQIPIYIHGARDGRFDPGDYILFWGQAHQGEHHYKSPYTSTNVYWLVSGGGIGLRMVEQDGAPAGGDEDSLITPQSYRTTYRREEDRTFLRLTQVRDDTTADRWLWEELGAVDSVVYNFWATDVAPSGQCEIEVRLRGETYPPVGYGEFNHHTKISLNGILLEDDWWRHQDEHIYHKANLPNSYIWEGKNVLKIKNMGDTPAGDVDKIYMNWFRIDYWRGHSTNDNYLEFGPSEIGETGLHQFDVSGFTSSDIELFDLAGKKIVNFEVSQDSIAYTLRFQDRLLRPTRYVASTKGKMKVPTGVYPNEVSNLHDVTNGADYIIIVHADFYESVLPLVTHRESQGLRTRVVLVQDIYDEFNDGLLRPQAIRDFLKYAYENWQQPAPSYVLLVGDTSWGYDKSITHQIFWPEGCFVPTMMVWTSGWGVSACDNRFVCLAGQDRLPDMAIGRFPVSTKAEADALVDKVLQYELNPEMGPWRKRIQLLAGTGFEEDVFQQFCVQAGRSYIPPAYELSRIYTGAGSIHYGSTQDLIRQWDEGVVLAAFNGHGGGSVWFDANFFLLEDVQLLNNPSRLPVVFSLTCFVGYFDNPWYSSLGEEILRAEGKGAVAHFGSSGVAWAYEDNLLGFNLFQAIFQGQQRAIGMITTQSKLGQIYISDQLVDVFNLLGDPAMKLALPAQEISLELSDNSLPLGEAISIQGHIPGDPNGTAVVAFCDVDSSGWSADTSSLGGLDKIAAPRIPVIQESISVANGQLNLDILPPDTLVEHPFYEPVSGNKSITAYFWNQETDAIGWAPFALDAPYLVNIRHEPELPMAWEETNIYADLYLDEALDADGPDSVMCFWGARSTMLYNKLIMSTEDGVTYRTDDGISAPPGESVFYQIKVWYGGVGGSPSTDSLLSEIMQYQVQRIPNLQATRWGLFLFVDEDQLQIGCWVHNRSVVDMDSVLVRFYDDHPDSNRPIGDHRIAVVPATDSALAQVLWEAPGEPHELWVWVDPDGELEESPWFDNYAYSSFSNVFLGTPQYGTTVRGSNARVCHTTGNAACQISSGALSQSALFYIDDLPSDSACYDPVALYQPGLSLASLQDGGIYPYGFVFDESSPSVNSATIAFWYDPEDTLTQSAIQENNLKICYLSEQSGKWVLISDQELLADSAMVRASVNHLGVFGLFLIDDREPPSVRIKVEGQSFANGDYISTNPVISAVIEDENGIDINDHPVEVTLNGSPVASSEYSCAYSPETSNLCLLTYMPQLSAGSDTLVVKAYDCLGKSAADTIFFNVTAGFEIPFVANHPNPFQTETVIAFVVASDSPAERVTIRIYTVRGRLVRELQSQNVGPGYMEVIWDGCDQQGERVANGVYYYKLTVVKGDGEKLSPIVNKMAKLE